jgi:phosphinothricin acetyltransferase
MSIRPATERDFPAIAAITNHYIATTTIHFGYEPVTADELAAGWRGSRFPWLVTTDDTDTAIGYAKATVWRERAAYNRTTELGLYIAHDLRGRGLGTALYRELIAEVTRRGFHSAIAGITLPNDASLALHRRLGFVDVGVVRDAGWKLDRWNDVAFFQLML